MAIANQSNHRRSLTGLMLLMVMFLLVVTGAPVSAVTVEGLYNARVPVPGSDPGQLAQGYRDGLEQVLTRVSGDADVLQAEGVDEVLENAESLIQSYEFQRGQNGEDQLLMSFGPVGVNQALASLGAPVWGANRPLTLAWIAVEERGNRSLLVESSGDQETAGNWTGYFREAADRRGLPLVLAPAEASGDRRLLSEVWGQFMEPVRRASRDVPHDLLAVVRISRRGGEWEAGWSYQGQGVELTRTLSAPTPEALGRAVVDAWSDELASRFAVSAGVIGQQGGTFVNLVIEGVGAVTDYAAIKQALGRMNPVTSAGAVEVTRERITLKVVFTGELGQLKQNIALDDRFQPVSAEEVESRAREAAGPAQPGTPDGPGAAPSEREPDRTGAMPVDGASTSSSEQEGAESGEPAPTATLEYHGLNQDREEAERAFESLYETLYYRWRSGVITTPAPDGQ